MDPAPDFDVNDFLQRSAKAGEDFEAGGPPSIEKFLEMLENVKDMSDEEKEQMKNDLIMRAIRAAQMGQGTGDLGKFTAGPREYLIFTLMILLIVAVFGKRHV